MTPSRAMTVNLGHLDTISLFFIRKVQAFSFGPFGAGVESLHNGLSRVVINIRGTAMAGVTGVLCGRSVPLDYVST